MKKWYKYIVFALTFVILPLNAFAEQKQGTFYSPRLRMFNESDVNIKEGTCSSTECYLLWTTPQEFMYKYVLFRGDIEQNVYAGKNYSLILSWSNLQGFKYTDNFNEVFNIKLGGVNNDALPGYNVEFDKNNTYNIVINFTPQQDAHQFYITAYANIPDALNYIFTSNVKYFNLNLKYYLLESASNDDIYNAIENLTDEVSKTNAILTDETENSDGTCKGVICNLKKLVKGFLNIFSLDAPDLGGLDGSAGWLPAGPVDSLVNLPLTFLNSLNNGLNSTCSPVSIPLPFFDNKSIILPCYNNFFETYLNDYYIWFSAFSHGLAAYILYKYFLHFYKWIDNVLTLRENSWQDWGGD